MSDEGNEGSWPAAGRWGAVLTSPPQPPGEQVPGAEPRRRGGPCGHALAASPRCPRGGSARAAAGAARSRAPLPSCARAAAEPAPAPGPARSEPGTEDRGRRHGSLRCVGRTPVPAPASLPRTLSPPPPAARRPLSPLAVPGCSLGSARDLCSFSSFLSSCRRLPSPTFSRSASQAVARFPAFPCPSSSESPFLPPALALELLRVDLSVELTL